MQQQLHHSHGPTAPNNHFGPIGSSSPSRSLSPNPLALGIGQNDPFYFPNIGLGMYPQFNGGPRNIFDSHFHQEANGLYANGANGGGGNGGATNVAGTTGAAIGVVNGGGSVGSGNGHNKFSSYIEPHGFYGLNNQLQPLSQQNGNVHNGGNLNNNAMAANNPNNNVSVALSAAVGSISAVASGSGQQQSQLHQQQTSITPISSSGSVNNQDSNNSKLIDGLNSFYSNATGPYQHLLVAN